MSNSEIDKLQAQASIDNLGQSMIFLLHLDYADRPGTGAAVLVSRGGCTYIASALHNFVVDEKDDTDSIVKIWNETEFHVREVSLRFHAPLTVPSPLAARKGTARSLLIDRKFDLVAVRLQPEDVLPSGAHPVDLDHRSYTRDVEPGANLITLGLPIGGVRKSEDGHKLVPYKFSAHFDPNVSKPNVSEDDYLLYPYTGIVGAKGYSGAPVWLSQETEPELLWKANPIIVGIALKHFTKANLIQAVKIKHLISLLKADILPEASASMRAG
jgi:hypothetical protein